MKILSRKEHKQFVGGNDDTYIVIVGDFPSVTHALFFKRDLVGSTQRSCCISTLPTVNCKWSLFNLSLGIKTRPNWVKNLHAFNF